MGDWLSIRPYPRFDTSNLKWVNENFQDVANIVNRLITQVATNVTNIATNAAAISDIFDATTWDTYTPTWTSTVTNPTIGNGTLAGYYKAFGKIGLLHVYVLFGSTSTVGSGLYYAYSLPTGWSPVSSSVRQSGSGIMYRPGTSEYPMHANVDSTIGLYGTYITGGGLGYVGPTTPYGGWNAGESLAYTIMMVRS